MSKSSRDDAVFDTILAQAFNDAVTEEIQKIESECQKNTQLSEKYKKIERKAYQKHIKHKNSVSLTSRLKPLQRVVACFLVIIMVGLIVIFSVPTVRADFFNLVINVFDKYISFNSITNSNSYSLVTEEYIFNYIPNQYIQSAYDGLGGVRYTFDSTIDDTYFKISYYSSTDTSINIDNEHTSITEYSINGNIAYLLEFDISAATELIWNDGKNLFSISGTISKDLMLKIANNILYKSE